MVFSHSKNVKADFFNDFGKESYFINTRRMAGCDPGQGIPYDVRGGHDPELHDDTPYRP
jgi:hypothetical protein